MIHGGKHIRVYDKFFKIKGGTKARICELTGRPYAHICHIDASGMGGRASAHHIDNLMAMDRHIHEYTEGKTELKDWLRTAHLMYKRDGIPFCDRKNAGDPVFCQILRAVYPKFSKKRDVFIRDAKVQTPDEWDAL